MKKYNGAILSWDGDILFEFTTPFLDSPFQADLFASELCSVWSAHKDAAFRFGISASDDDDV